MLTKAEGIVWTVVIVLACIAFYNSFLVNYTPATIQGWIGLGSGSSKSK